MICWQLKNIALRHFAFVGVTVWFLAFASHVAQAQDSRFETPTFMPVSTLGGAVFGSPQEEQNQGQDKGGAEELEDIEGEVIPSGSGKSVPDFGVYGPVGEYQQQENQGLEVRKEGVVSESSPLPNQYRSEFIEPDWMGKQDDSAPLSSRRPSSVLQTRPERTVTPKLDSPQLRIDGMKAVEKANRKFDSSSHEIVRERYPDGSIKIVRTIAQDTEGNYYNDGGWLMYDPQQRPIASGTFVRGAMEGDWERVHEVGAGGLFSQMPFSLFNGPYLSRANFVRNEIDGVWTISDKNEKLICSITYENGVRKGVASWYFPSGKKMREATFKDGVPHGFVLQWDQQGKLQRREQFVDGRRVIRKKTTYANQQLASEKVFRDRKLTPQGVDNWWAAKPATFDRDGEQVQYGPVAEWYPNRQPKMTGRFVNGERDGLFTWWHESHNKKAEGNFSRGMRVGVWRYWHESGMKRSEGRFENDEPIGLWRSWNKDGRVVDEKDFSVTESEVEMPEEDDESESVFNDEDSTSTTETPADDSESAEEEQVSDGDPFGENAESEASGEGEPGSLSNLFGG